MVDFFINFDILRCKDKNVGVSNIWSIRFATLFFWNDLFNQIHVFDQHQSIKS